MAQPQDVDRAAPVLAHQEIDIDAPLERVWALHTHVARWPEWQTEITEARIEGPFEPGTSFDWTSYGFSVRSTIYDVDSRSRVLWGGTAEGITAFTSGCSPRLREAFTWRRTSRSRVILWKPTRPPCSRCSMPRLRPGSVT